MGQALAKSRSTGLDVQFLQAGAQSLPFPDASFDVVVSTLMLHHLGPKDRALLAREICRVLRPDGRLLAVEFRARNSSAGRWSSRIHRHGHLREDDMAAVLQDAGMIIEASGPVEWSGTRAIGKMHFALASVSRDYHLRLGI